MNSQDILDRYNFQTGDLILFHHDTKHDKKTLYNRFFDIITNTIMYATKSKYSHVGMIVKDPEFTSPPLKGIYLLESSSETFPDAEDHKVKIGVELVPFKEILDTYKDEYFYWRQLKCDRNDAFYENLDAVHRVIHNKPYDLDLLDWIKAYFKDYSPIVQKTNEFWCSALVAYIYVYLGFLDKDISWSYISPEQLGTESQSNPLQFKNCSLYDEIKIN
tara:strand:+ start:191 stop:844 length:654 start_codon:yes stop_codon:yes gene_type:complete